MRESALWKRAMLAVHKMPGVRMFRHNVGQGWVGRSRRLKPGESYRARGGEIVILDPRPLHAGLVKGAGDGLGWRTITVTPDMVGARVAVFFSMETKTKDGRLSPEQRNWHQQVLAAGGISLIVRKPEDAAQLDALEPLR